MYIEDFIAQFSLEQIIHIENTQDHQYLSLRNAREDISSKYWNTDKNKIKFLDGIVYNSLVSYQIWWDGFLWRAEFADKIATDWDVVDIYDPTWRYNFLYNSRYNKRLINMKIRRIEKILGEEIWRDIWDYERLYTDMKSFNHQIASITSNKQDMKTIVFATKMYGYGCRIVFDTFVPYPTDIDIPLDSRIIKIFEHNTRLDKYTNHDIRSYYKDLSIRHSIPPLHLDSLLWIKYWDLLKGL